MKFRGPASSLYPARESARASERARQQQHNTHGSGGPIGPSGAAVPTSVGAWTLTTDEHGRLVAEHADGARRVLADQIIGQEED